MEPTQSYDGILRFEGDRGNRDTWDISKILQTLASSSRADISDSSQMMDL
jgi:hypothetical protein